MTDEEQIVKQEVVKQDNAEKTVYHYINSEKELDIKVREVYKKIDKTVLFQLRRDWGTKEIKPKFEYLKTITLVGFKSKIPLGFSQKASVGYRPTSTLDPFIKFIAKNSQIEDIIISKTSNTSLSRNNLFINHKDLEFIRKNIGSANRVNKARIKDFIQNYLAKNFPAKFATAPRKYHKGTLFRILSEHKNISKEINNDDKNSLLDLFEKLSFSKKDIFEKRDLILTKEKIEKKFIEDVLTEFERLISLKKVREGKWQDFFKENAWIFSQLFAHPTVLFEDQAYVGGKNIRDKQGKYVDFLYQNKLTKNSAIVEIKKHNTKLLSKKPYRGNNVFNMDKDFSGAISQILDQKATYCRKFDSIRAQDDIHPFNPRCILVIGSISTLTKEQQECFELLRSNLKDVEVITFDELLEKIKGILSIFKNDENKV